LVRRCDVREWPRGTVRAIAGLGVVGLLSGLTAVFSRPWCGVG
jgi:hypothetical protein